MKRIYILGIGIFFLFFPCLVIADEEAVNWPIVKSSEDGRFYIKSIPDEILGQNGKSSLYKVDKDKDKFICTFNWYANDIYIFGHRIKGHYENTIVRFGPWNRGQEPKEDHLAIGFYRKNQIVKEYSTKQIEKLGSGINRSISHYWVFGKRLGFTWLDGKFVYQVEGVSGKLFTFDLETGSVIEK